MNNPLIFLSVAFVAVLLAWTVRSIRANLMRRPFGGATPIGINFLEFFEIVLKIGCVFAILVVIPHPVTLILLVMVISALVTGSKLRYDEEVRSLNRWVRTGVTNAVSIPNLIENLAEGCSSSVGKRAKSFAYRVDRGETVLDAARRSGLPLDADTLAMISIPAPARIEPVGAMELPDEFSTRETFTERSIIPQQFVYVVALIVFASLIGMFIREYPMAMIEQMRNEYSVESDRLSGALDIATTAGNVTILLLAIWLIPVLLPRRWTPYWLIRCTPWFGRLSIARGRDEVLMTLVRGIRAAQPASEVLRFAEKSVRYRWAGRRSRKALRWIESGTSLPHALQRGNLITAAEQTWLSSAEKNSHLADAIEQLVHSNRRRQSLTWKLRVAWVVPLVTVAVGAYVLVHALSIFYILFAMVGRIPQS